MNEELKKQVSNRVPRLGHNELLLACSKAKKKNDENEIVALVEEFRSPFAEGKVASIGSASFASPTVWQEIAEASDKAAKNALLADSAELKELQKLERAAAEAKALADAKSRQLQADWQEYNSLPERAEAASNWLRLATQSANSTLRR
jgi:hypothetical protein